MLAYVVLTAVVTFETTDGRSRQMCLDPRNCAHTQLGFRQVIIGIDQALSGTPNSGYMDQICPG